MIRLADHLRELRGYTFVGRQEELRRFRAALAAPPGSAPVLFVHGPGGIGKSALLRRFALEAADAGRPVVEVDCRRSGPDTAGFATAAAQVTARRDAVLLVDALEAGEELEEWLSGEFLPALPADVLVVLAGRRPPGAAWRIDASWVGLLDVLRLGNLSRPDAATLLSRRGVPAARQEPLLRFAGGHPLALCLAAQAAAQPGGQPVAQLPARDGDATGWTPPGDVVGRLLPALIGEPPSPRHRRALEICAIAMSTTEELLRSVMPENPDAMFEWLRRQPFVEIGELGLYLHDVVRDTLDADLRWRDPEVYAELRDRIHHYLTQREATATASERLRIEAAMMFLHRGSVMGRFFTWSRNGQGHADAFRPQDLDAARRMTALTEGRASAELVSYWFERQPEAFTAYRCTGSDELAAFHVWLRLEQPEAEDLVVDPVVAAAWEHALAHAPLREGERLGMTRFMVDPVRYQRPSPVMDAMLFRIGHQLRRDGRLAWSFAVLADHDFWQPMMDYCHMSPIADRVVVDGRELTLFAHDWRTMPMEIWRDRLGRLVPPQVAAGRTTPPVAVERSAAPLVVLDRADFDAAVRTALRGLSGGSLASNRLVQSRMVATALAAEAGPAREAAHGVGPDGVLRRLVTEAVAALAEDPRDGKLHRAVTRTYLYGAVTQEAAAEDLGVSLSSYKRHLTAGVQRVCDRLWQRELGGPGARRGAPEGLTVRPASRADVLAGGARPPARYVPLPGTELAG